MALHDLFVIGIHTGEKHPEEYAREAYTAYGPEHPRMPALAFDAAYLWVNQGYFTRAINVLRALLQQFDEPEHQLQVVALAARAAGACGELEFFDSLRSVAQEKADRLGNRPKVAASLVDVAVGAMSLSRWEQAVQILKRAITVAEERSEPDVLAKAESALDAAMRHRHWEKPARPLAPRHVKGSEDILAEDLVRALQSAAGGTTD